MTEKIVKIDIDYVAPNSHFAFPLYSSEGDKVLSERTPLTKARLNQLKSEYGRYLYYKDTGDHYAIPIKRIKQAYDKSVNIMEEIRSTQKLSKPALREAEDIINQIINDLYSAEIEAISLLKELRTSEEYLYTHSVNVGVLSAIFAKLIGIFTKEQIKYLTLGAYLLDIGSLKIDTRILNKEGKLTDPEMLSIKRHPQLGYEMLKSIPGINPIILQTVLFHHERFDDQGYFQMPYEQLPRTPKIVSACDIYDALTTDRPFRKAISPSKALVHMVNAVNTFFDYQLVSDFINLLGPLLNNTQSFYSKEDFVELNTKEIAVIKEYGIKDYLKPVVKVICRFQKEKNNLIVKFYDTPLDVDLQQDSSRKMTKIINNETHIKAIRSKMLSLGTDTSDQI